MKNKLLIGISLMNFMYFTPALAQSGESINTNLVNFTPQFFICIIAGLLLAMGFQVVLTILSLASGVSLIGNLEKSSSKKNVVAENAEDVKKESTPILVMISTAAGVWTVVTVSVSLFFASLLAVKLSLISNNAVGITLGLVIWAAFFMLMMYLELKSVNSLLGLIFNTAFQGLKYSFASLQKVFGSSTETKIAKIAEHAVSGFGKEISHALGDGKIAKKLDKYVKELKPKALDMDKIKTELLKIFKDVEIEEKIDRKDIDVNETHFYKIAEKHKSSTGKDAMKWAQLFVEAWGVYKFAGPVGDKLFSSASKASSSGDGIGIKETIESYLRDTGKEELNPDRLRSDFVRILNEPKLAKELVAEKVNALDRNTLISIIASKGEIAPEQINFMVDAVSGAFAFAKEKISSNGSELVNGQEDEKSKRIVDKIEDKFRNYLANNTSSGIDYDEAKADIIAIFHNPKATLSVLKNELNQYDRESLIAMFSSRENITSEEAEKLVVKIEEARNYVMTKIQYAESEIMQKAESAKKLALHEAEIVRKSAATAAWWLFVTAILSGLAAAAGGMLAIS